MEVLPNSKQDQRVLPIVDCVYPFKPGLFSFPDRDRLQLLLEECSPVSEELRGTHPDCQPVRLLRHPVQRHLVGFAVDGVRDGISLATLQFLFYIPAIRRLLEPCP